MDNHRIERHNRQRLSHRLKTLASQAVSLQADQPDSRKEIIDQEVIDE